MGYDPTIFYIKIGIEDKEGYIDCPSEEDIEIVSYVAKKYGCRFELCPYTTNIGIVWCAIRLNR